MDYKKGQIYCIRSHQTNKIYIGSTISPLYKRFYDHRCAKDCSAKEITQYSDAYIELVEEFPCNSKKELNRREGQHIRNAENCVNKRIEGRTKKEYENDNKEKFHKYQQEYREDNKEKIDKYQQEYFQQNKTALDNYKKAYNEKNKEQIKEYKKQYYLKKKFKSTASPDQLASSPSSQPIQLASPSHSS